MIRLFLAAALLASVFASGWFGILPWQHQAPATPAVAPTTSTNSNVTTPVSTGKSSTPVSAPIPKQPSANSNTTPVSVPGTGASSSASGAPTYATVTTGTYDKTIVSGGITRTYHVHIPTGYNPKNAYPLVFLFHGGNGTGESATVSTSGKPAGATFLANSGYTTKADSEKFIVVAPDGVDGNWNDGRGVTQPELQGIDDVAFVKDMVTSFETTYNIDKKRIFATGISNGAMLSARLGCEASSIFAAIAPVSGAMPVPVSQTCKASVSLVGIQGTNDPFAPIPDSDGVPAMTAKLHVGDQTLSVADTEAFWAKQTGCAATAVAVKQPVLVNDGTYVTQYTYPKCTNGHAVVFYIVTAMGHSWPPTTPAQLIPIIGPSSKNIVATDVTWSFFKAHPKM